MKSPKINTDEPEFIVIPNPIYDVVFRCLTQNPKKNLGNRFKSFAYWG